MYRDRLQLRPHVGAETGGVMVDEGSQERRTNQTGRKSPRLELEPRPNGSVTECHNPVHDETPEPSSEDVAFIRQLLAVGSSYLLKFQSSGVIEDITKSIKYLGLAVHLTPDSHKDKPNRISALVCAHLGRASPPYELEDLNKAIEYGSEMIRIARIALTVSPMLLGVLARAYMARFQCLEDVLDAHAGIEYAVEALSLVPSGSPERLQHLEVLGESYTVRFERLGQLPDLENAIVHREELVRLAPSEYPDRLRGVSRLGSSYVTRFSYLGELPDLEKGIDYQTEAVTLTSDDNSGKPAMLNDLGNAHNLRFNRLIRPDDLDKAIGYRTKAIALTPPDDPQRPLILGNLGASYISRFESLGKVSDIDTAIDYCTQAVAIDPNKPDLLGKLGGSFLHRFVALNSLPDLKNAVEYCTRANVLTPDDHPDKASMASNLGSSYKFRFERTGDLSDLDMAITYGTKAVLLTPDDHVAKLECFKSLGNLYHSRFRRLGELVDLNKSIEYMAKAIPSSPLGDHRGHAESLINLGSSYLARFERLGESSDLSGAIDSEIKAIALTPETNPNKPIMLCQLGSSYLARFRHLDQSSDLSRAVEYGVEAVSLIPADRTARPGILSFIASVYRARYDHQGEPPDLDRAFKSLEEANLLLPEGHTHKPAILGDIANSYMSRYIRLDELQDLDVAIEYYTKAVSLIPDGHANQSQWLNLLGDAIAKRFIRSWAPSDAESAVGCYMKAAQSSTGLPFYKLQSCRKWARIAILDKTTSPLAAYQQAMTILPQFIWLGTTLDRRYSQITAVSDLATEAASCAIGEGSFDLALEWLEVGRSIIWGQIAQLRTPFDRLSAQSPTLASQLEEIGRKLERAGSRSSSVLVVASDNTGVDKEVRDHHQLALQWERLLNNARSIPGFEHFLRPLKTSQLRSAARLQPIAVINVSESQCDALIVHPNNNNISHVPLSAFSTENALMTRQNLISLVEKRAPGHLRQNGSFERSLEQLWSGVVKPILDSLGYTRKLPVDQLPRIIWCTTGLISFLPLHAARPCDPSESGAFDLVISSYTPTLSALIASQSITPGDKCGILAVGQEHTPGLVSLPGTRDELAIVKQHIKSGHYLQLENEEATIERVLDAMSRFNWVHLACHGSQDTTNPTQSAFHLHNGSLTLATITKQAFRDKGLAFLSACQTATGDENMPEEAVHLAAGMLMAGFPSVIGTMWSIADEDGPKIADKVYAELLKDGKPDHTKAAKALHRAVAHLRTKVGEESIARWAPFIHLGS